MKRKIDWHLIGLISLVLLAFALFFTIGPGMRIVGLIVDVWNVDSVKSSLPFDPKCYPLNSTRQYQTTLIDLNGITVYNNEPRELELENSIEAFPNHSGEYYPGITVGEHLKSKMENVQIIGFIIDPGNPACSTVWWHVVLNQDSQITIKTK